MANDLAQKYKGARGFDKARNVIMIFLQGGPSHIESGTRSLNAPANIRGEFKPIKTKIAGTQIGEHMPLMAQALDKVTLIRSMSYTRTACLITRPRFNQNAHGYRRIRCRPRTVGAAERGRLPTRAAM